MTTFITLATLTALTSKTISWAETQAGLIDSIGWPLDEEMNYIAKKVGVLHPEHIRIVEVPSLPLPDEFELRQAALNFGLIGSNMAGMTLGYGIFICKGFSNIRLLSHEFRHVRQYEEAGSVAAFMTAYLNQIATVGYYDAPFEIDARAHEIIAIPLDFHPIRTL